VDLKIKGIDISNNNGNHIDFHKLKLAGIEIVYMKVSEGISFKDPYVSTFYAKAKAEGLKVGFYHFFRVGKNTDTQAQLFVNTLNSFSAKADCLHMCDVENDNGFKASYISEQVNAFITKVEKLTGKECGIYTYSAFAQQFFQSTLTKYKLWIANYCGENKVPTCNPWSTYVGHQYSQKSVVSGIQGYVDADNFTSGIYLGTPVPAPSKPTTPTSPKYSIKNLQEVLKKLGHYKGDIDGIMGNMTINAIKDFEKKNKLKITGKVNGATYNLLKHYGLK
jgi:lysozyme